MKYNGFYFWMFKSPMKKVLTEKYGKAYASEIMKKSKKVYRELVEKADDIGDDNPMAYNELFALAFVAPYVASEKKIPPTTVQEMMRRSLYHIKWYFADRTAGDAVVAGSFVRLTYKVHLERGRILLFLFRRVPLVIFHDALFIFRLALVGIQVGLCKIPLDMIE